jgi:hypothetical protein
MVSSAFQALNRRLQLVRHVLPAFLSSLHLPAITGVMHPLASRHASMHSLSTRAMTSFIAATLPACFPAVTGVMHPLASEVIKACIPAGQAKPFPANCMALMTVSGAKGSTVNFSQIACLLGQQVCCLVFVVVLSVVFSYRSCLLFGMF